MSICMSIGISAEQFKKIIYAHYRAHAREFPWRNTKNPYHIFVSEIMLQQTQAGRVREKYGEFIKTFPNFRALAEASPRDILRAWLGLGYNRRALFLKRAAREIVRVYGGELPRRREKLETFSGIGPATARSIRVFAFNEPDVFIETNIRTVYLHFFFPKSKNVPDKKLLPFIEKTLDRKNPREWYYALMDYGAMLKKSVANPNRRSATHIQQKKFKGSLREARGAILRVLLKYPHSLLEVKKALHLKPQKIERAIVELTKEGFLKEKNGTYFVAT